MLLPAPCWYRPHALLHAGTQGLACMGSLHGASCAGAPAALAVAAVAQAAAVALAALAVVVVAPAAVAPAVAKALPALAVVAVALLGPAPPHSAPSQRAQTTPPAAPAVPTRIGTSGEPPAAPDALTMAACLDHAARSLFLLEVRLWDARAGQEAAEIGLGRRASRGSRRRNSNQAPLQVASCPR